MAKRSKAKRTLPSKNSVQEPLPPKATEESSNVKYFAPESTEQTHVDKDVTHFLLEETSDTPTPPSPRMKAEDREGKDMSKWYVLATLSIFFIILVLYLVNTDFSAKEKTNTTAETDNQTEINDSSLTENKSMITGPINPKIGELRDFTLATVGLRPAKTFLELHNRKDNLINDCNDSAACKSTLKGYKKLGLRTESHSYTITINKDGRITDLRSELEAGTNFVIDASEGDILALYNAIAINDEETALLKLQKILPSDFYLHLLQSVMAS